MEHSYGFYRQSSGLWRSLRDGDFEEEDVWAVLKDRTDPSIKIGRSKESSVSVPTHVPTAERMIPRADKGSCSGSSNGGGGGNSTHESRIFQQSAPVNIPDWSNIYRKKPNKASKNGSLQDDDEDYGGFVNDRRESDDEDDCYYDDDDDDGYDEKVPPHEFIARRLARSQISSFSVFEGVGRTLKGRDLSKVRNAVLTKTGFLESL
uniref:nucleosome-remodeling factor subunit BPTF n=1 Tax=Ziziphus jujuba TaxID=326968 RepID=A0A6P4BKF6_ZIZJJ